MSTFIRWRDYSQVNQFYYIKVRLTGVLAISSENYFGIRNIRKVVQGKGAGSIDKNEATITQGAGKNPFADPHARTVWY